MAIKQKHGSIIKRGVALAVSLATIFSLAAARPAYAADAALTRGKAAELLLNYAGHYREGIKTSDFISGYPDGSKREEQPVTRLEALVMASRAFGDLPAPTGSDALAFPKAAEYSDIPEWAQVHIDNLNKARILVGAEDGLLKGSEPMPESEMMLILRRLFSLYGTYLKDDFYATVNHDIIKKEVKWDDDPTGAFAVAGKAASDKLDELFDAVVNGQWEAGTPEKKIADLYESIKNMEARDKAGVAPVKPYLDAIGAVKNLKDFEALQIQLKKELAFDMVFTVGLGPNLSDSNGTLVYVQPKLGSLGESYTKGEKLAKVEKHAETLLTLAGDANPALSAAAATRLDAELSILRNKANEENEDLPIADTVKPYTMEQIQELCPNFDFKALLAASGLKEEPLYYMDVVGAAMMKEIAKVYTEGNLEALKALSKYQLLSAFSGCLSQAFIDAEDIFAPDDEEEEELPPEEQEKRHKDELRAETLGFVSDYFSDKYGEKYFPKEAKDDVTNMIKIFVADYKGRIENLDWMSAETKSMALKKLETLVIKVGYPDKKSDLLNKVNFTSAANGGSYFSNMLAVSKYMAEEEVKMQGKPVDKTEWGMPSFEVNAYYNPQANEIVFPAGILQQPFYSLEAKPEQNYAGIGWVIAHEITHGFDNMGSQFDEKGNTSNWWAEADKEEFQKRCDKVAAYYEGAEAAPGITKKSGKTTLGEDIADMGGISAALNAAAKLENPDYELFFRHATYVWAESGSKRDDYEGQESESHSYLKNRINKLFSTIDKFYEVFGVKEGDGMYVPPEQRVKVW